MTGQTDHTYIVGEVFAAELGAETDFAGFLEKLFLKLDIAECMTEFVAFGGKIVVILHRCLLYGGKVHLG